MTDSRPSEEQAMTERERQAQEFITAPRAQDPQELEASRLEAWRRDDECPVCDGTGGDHQIGCQQNAAAS